MKSFDEFLISLLQLKEDLRKIFNYSNGNKSKKWLERRNAIIPTDYTFNHFEETINKFKLTIDQYISSIFTGLDYSIQDLLRADSTPEQSNVNMVVKLYQNRILSTNFFQIMNRVI